MAKTVNYTTEQVSALTQAYTAADDQATRDNVVQSFAEKFGKSVASIRAKLSREGVYVKKEYKTKSGAESIRKAQKVAYIAASCGKDLESFDSLEKVTHAVLDALIEKLNLEN